MLPPDPGATEEEKVPISWSLQLDNREGGRRLEGGQRGPTTIRASCKHNARVSSTRNNQQHWHLEQGQRKEQQEEKKKIKTKSKLVDF